jgi:hypothetical protein
MEMENTSEFQSRKDKIIPINSDSTLKNDIIKEKMLEEKGMANDTYSKREIDDKFNKLESKIENLYTKNEIDLKFENLEQKISSGFENMTLRMENLLLEFKADTKKEQEANKKWLIGIAISIIALLVTAILKFF